MATHLKLIYCADGNPLFARCAVSLGWLYGARLPAKVYETLHFADQDWKKPNRVTYMRAVQKHRPPLATVLDWERPEQLEEVLSWADEISSLVTEGVIIIPKVRGGVHRLPKTIDNKQVILGYSIPTSYGSTSVSISELRGWPIHLLGGSPHRQMSIYQCLRRSCTVVSTDGNMAHQQAHRCRYWSPTPDEKGHWIQLASTGDLRRVGANLEAFGRSLKNIAAAWDDLTNRPPPYLGKFAD